LLVLIAFRSYWAFGGTRFLSEAWDGKYAALPSKFRVTSTFSVLMYALAIGLVLTRVGAPQVGLSPAIATLGLLVLAPVFLFSSLANFVSRSKLERYLNAPTSLLLAAMLLFITFNQFNGDD